jgi:hypothetical protein
VEQKADNGLFATLSKLNCQKEKKMSEVNENQILRELQGDAAKWIMKTLPSRVGSGADEIEVRMQMKDEAEKWVQDTLKLRLEGKEGTASPDA